MKHLTGILILLLLFFSGESRAQKNSEGEIYRMVKLISTPPTLYLPAIAIESLPESQENNESGGFEYFIIGHIPVISPLPKQLNNHIKDIVSPFQASLNKTLTDLPPPLFYSLTF